MVLTTGTFLGGIIHIGDERIRAGNGDESSTKLAKKIRSLDLSIGRLKIRTPPRLLKSINWERVEMQSADLEPYPLI